VSAHVIALAATLVLAALARLYRLANIPNGFSPDEASYGYNGYSFLLTGRDRFGNAFPLFADNFGDLISTSYMWLTVPSIWLFGLDEFAVRLPAALAGIVTVFVLYKLGGAVVNRWVGLVAALLLAISPWHIQVSRYAERSQLLPLFFCLGLWLFLRWRKEGGRKLLWSVLCFGLCFYTYASARVFAPLFIAGAALLYFRELRAAGRYALWPLGILVACFLPAALHWISPAGMARASYLLEFAPFDWLVNYLSYLGPDYLFFNGDPEIRHSLLNVGQLYFFELATLPMGIFFLVRRKRKEDALLGLWLALYPIPAALTDPSHAIRSIVGVPLFALVSACGLYQAVLFARGRNRWLLGLVCTGMVAGSAVVCGQRYFVDYPGYAAVRWSYGMREVMHYAEAGSHRQVYISNRIFLSHIFALCYSAYPPEKYQRQPLRVQQGNWRYNDFAFGRYHILPMWQIDARAQQCGDALLLALAGEARQMAERTPYRLVHSVKVPDGRTAFEIYECE
jgi:4-amino-4-deoxy-L-arabinose transferase-like glycosyltransferase